MRSRVDAYGAALEVVRHVWSQSTGRRVQTAAWIGHHVAVGVVRVVRGHAVVASLKVYKNVKIESNDLDQQLVINDTALTALA